MGKKEFENEKEELEEQLQNLQNDWENLGVGIELLDYEINKDNCSENKIKKLIEDVELCGTTLKTTIDDLDEARLIFQKKQIINNLNT